MPKVFTATSDGICYRHPVCNHPGRISDDGSGDPEFDGNIEPFAPG